MIDMNPRSGENFFTDLNQMIGLHDASWIRRLTQQANLTWFR